MQGVDMASRIISIAAVGAKAIMTMSNFIIAIVQASCVKSALTIFTTHTTFVRLNGHTIPFFELGHIWRDSSHHTGEFMARDELA